MTTTQHLYAVIRKLGEQVRKQAATIRRKNIEIEAKDARIKRLEGQK